MLKRNILYILYSLIVLSSVLTYLNIKDIFCLEYTFNYSLQYSGNMVGSSVYESKSNNSMKCNLNTVNSIIKNMLIDFYVIYKDDSNDNIIDIILTKDNKFYRILYNRSTGDYLCMSKPFLENSLPQTYINIERR